MSTFAAMASMAEKDRLRIAELEALYNHELSCGRTVRESNRKLKAELAELREAITEHRQCFNADEGDPHDLALWALLPPTEEPPE